MSRYEYMYGRRALNGVNMAEGREEDRGVGGGWRGDGVGGRENREEGER